MNKTEQQSQAFKNTIYTVTCLNYCPNRSSNYQHSTPQLKLAFTSVVLAQVQQLATSCATYITITINNTIINNKFTECTCAFTEGTCIKSVNYQLTQIMCIRDNQAWTAMLAQFVVLLINYSYATTSTITLSLFSKWFE